MQQEAFWSPEDLARYLRVPLATVYSWRHRGLGPKGIKIGKHVRYSPDSVRVWLERQSSERVTG